MDQQIRCSLIIERGIGRGPTALFTKPEGKVAAGRSTEFVVIIKSIVGRLGKS